MANSLTRRERGVVLDRGYVLIRFWPWGRKNKPYIEHFGPSNDVNIKLANFKMREYRNKAALNAFDVERPAVPMLFREAWPLFLKNHKASLNTYEPALVPYFGTYYLHDITPQLVKEWRKEREKTVTFATVNKNQAILSSLFERFKEWNAIGGIFADKVKLPTENPCQYVTKPTERHRARKRRLSPEEWDRLSLAVAKATVNHKGLVLEAGWLLDIAKMALYSSLRLKDVLQLAGRAITGDELADLQAKNAEKGIMYQVPLTESLRAIAQRIAARTRVNPWVVQKYFREACNEAGILDCTIRDLRRTGLSWLDKHGTRRTVVRDRAGHADAKTTEIYVGSDTGEQLAAIQKLEATFK
jgi:integrase